MKVRWTSEAEQDRDLIWEFIAVDDPGASVRMDELFSEAVAKLNDFPKMGSAGKIPGTRDLIPHDSYRIVYEIVDDVIWILAVVHTARQWPPVI